MKIKLDKDFDELGLQSWMSYDSLKRILEDIDKLFSHTSGTKITGFTFDEDGIKIHRGYVK